MTTTYLAAGMEVEINETPHVFFNLLGLDVTTEIVTEWGVMLVILLVAFLATRNMKMRPAGMQNAAELLVDFLVDGIIAPSIGGRKKALRYLPFLGTIFLFIIISNYTGLLPHVPWIKTPTSSLSVPVALAILAFLATQFAGFKEKGFHYLGHFFKPYAFMFPLNLLEEFIRPISLALRLFGNIFGEHAILGVLLVLVPWVIPVPIMTLDLLFGFLQAFIFTTLTAVYIGGAIGEGH